MPTGQQVGHPNPATPLTGPAAYRTITVLASGDHDDYRVHCVLPDVSADYAQSLVNTLNKAEPWIGYGLEEIPVVTLGQSIRRIPYYRAFCHGRGPIDQAVIEERESLVWPWEERAGIECRDEMEHSPAVGVPLRIDFQGTNLYRVRDAAVARLANLQQHPRRG